MTALAGPCSSGVFAANCRVTDGVVAAISRRLADRPPERGGALLVVGGLIHLFVEDTHGRYTSASWDISAQLSQTVGLLEAAGHGTLVGTVHSHPPGVPDPSPRDVATTAKALQLNPHLDGLLIAIVTEGSPRAQDLPIGERHRLSVHELVRSEGAVPRLARIRGDVVPLVGDLSAAGVKLSSATSTRAWQQHQRRGQRRGAPSRRAPIATAVSVNGRGRLAVPVTGVRTAALLLDAEYPAVGPLAVTTAFDDAGTAAHLVPLPSPWDPVSPATAQLAAAVRAAGGRRVKGAERRVWPLTGRLADRRVLTAGLGSVGSRIAEDLVRCGVGHVIGIDPETVEPANLSRTVYTAGDLGSPKTEALARRLRAIDPAVDVQGHCRRLGQLDLAGLLTGLDLVIAAVDDLSEQALLAHHAYAAGVPLVACALYRAAAAGEVSLVVPAVGSACWSCAVGSGALAFQRPEQDYGLGGRLVGEAALGPSIHLVADVASVIAVGLLAGPGTRAGAPLARLLAERRTLGVIATTPGWDFFTDVFAGMHHQHAPQSVWVRVDPNPQCPVCGTTRTPPATAADGAALVGVLAELRRSGSQGTVREGSARDCSI